MSNLPFYGEAKCGAKYVSGTKKGDSCANQGYYVTPGGQIRCGVHSKKAERKELKKNPKAAEKKEQDLQILIKTCMEESKSRRKAGIPGKVACAKMPMLKRIPQKDFHIPVFPNFKHANRPDGIGCKTLSPMDLGPVVHNQPLLKWVDDELKIVGKLPDALNLENFWQGSKVFANEVFDKDKLEDDTLEKQKEELESDKKCDEIFGDSDFDKILGCEEEEVEVPKEKVKRSTVSLEDRELMIEEEPERSFVVLDMFRENQQKWFLDKTPHRHKSKEECLGWVWVRPDGTQKIFNWVNSRQFYCNFYERLVVQKEEYVKLKGLLNRGLNLLILGYDGIDIENWGLKEDPIELKLEKLYLNKTRPFGHELCLVTMLVIQDPNNYPWRKYKTEDF